MVDVMSSEKRSELMSRIRGKNTGPELKLRRAAWAMGLRYRLHLRVERARPDMVFLGARVAVFVDGCFWHCCPLHGVIPKNNRTFWQPKLDRNAKRDVETNKKFIAAGWKVLRFWEHEVDDSPELCARKIADAVLKNVSYAHKK
ncbi:very short patch repair endonuclease [Collimonas sp.]|uniref:very short patch repair endonuclease n=1 Tax=Collimonas sp. TaxID=1963772 RepID=UPI002D1BA06B|nr:very short patch repair endonuclease [Collimonas sp.]HWW05890.1 very short patch repair endonuclease [Collimonas sp.]